MQTLVMATISFIPISLHLRQITQIHKQLFLG